jgi:protein-S-isoprenylcysteine O-methyltransferase Ste14
VGNNPLLFREIAVVVSAVIYWGGVIINVYRVRSHIGRSPNLIKRKDFKEVLLLSGWFFVIGGWTGQPLLLNRYGGVTVFSLMDPLLSPEGIALGIVLAVCGYAGTLWCYSTLGDSWRLGINGKSKTELVKRGAYRLVRHPIYSFQIVILIGMACLLPTIFSVMILLIHYACISIMAFDEEAYLMDTHGPEYLDYFSRTGRFIPRLKKNPDNSGN